MDRRFFAAVATIPPAHRKLLTYHDSFPFFGARYGFEIIGAIQPSGFKEPSPRDVAALVRQIRAAGVPAIFGSEVFPSEVLQTIADEAGAVHVRTLRDDDLPGELGDAHNTLVAMMHAAADVGAVLDYRRDAAYTILTLTIPGSRAQSTVTAARAALEADLAPLAAADGITRVGLIGSPFEREETLVATTDALVAALPIAAIGALVLLLIAFRSFRYAIVTVIPVGLVAAWLYAVMYLAGFSLNFVTATIGAISIGVGIDYSIHMTARFREELHRVGDPRAALGRAADRSGVSLLASAGSTIVGFAIMGFAPMPLFASYGVLTAVMIALALAASLLVLPSLLLLVAPAQVRQPAQSDAPQRVSPWHTWAGRARLR